MIEIKNISKEIPYKTFESFYNKAKENNQQAVDAICISSHDPEINQSDARFVNLKYIINDEWTFFSNYNSPKSKQFSLSNNISATFYWNAIEAQIRIKAKIRKTDPVFSDEHFLSRNRDKNAIAISSNQSKEIDSYETVVANYKSILQTDGELSRPEFWGGFTFIPFYFEFWQGHHKRANKRKSYELMNGSWQIKTLQP